jgi:endonuclease/exonuclease/phosphatase family metal-dependent hydrolase
MRDVCVHQSGVAVRPKQIAGLVAIAVAMLVLACLAFARGDVVLSASDVFNTITVPVTGRWQTSTRVSVPMTLGAGVQQMTPFYATGGVNMKNAHMVNGAAPAPGSGTDVTVIQWNIEINDSSVAHAQTAMDLLMATTPRPQIITVAEAWLAHFNDYINRLEADTGQTWYGAFATLCPPGDWDGTTCTVTPTFPLISDQGVGIFSSFPIVSTSSTFLPFADCYTSARAAVRAAINVNGTVVQVFATHLQTGGCADDAQSRYDSMAVLRTWASGYSTPQLVAGDFNADRDQIDTPQGMLGAFIDSWAVVGSGPGYTTVTPNPTMKLDYWFADARGTAMPISSSVVTSTGTTSDHYPVAAMFQIPLAIARPPTAPTNLRIR